MCRYSSWRHCTCNDSWYGATNFPKFSFLFPFSTLRHTAPKNIIDCVGRQGLSIYTLNSFLFFPGWTIPLKLTIKSFAMSCLFCSVQYVSDTEPFIASIIKHVKKIFQTARNVGWCLPIFHIVPQSIYWKHARSLFENNILQKERKVQRAARRATSSSCYTHFSR